MPQARLPLPYDIGHAHFARDMHLWAVQMKCEIRELVVATRETIGETRAMIAEADRLLDAFGDEFGSAKRARDYFG
jgi:hypothetical protein